MNLIDITKYKGLPTGIYLFAFGGIPFKSFINSTELTYNGNMINMDIIRDMITDGLGASGILTYENRSNLSLCDMGALVKEKEHYWAYN